MWMVILQALFWCISLVVMITHHTLALTGKTMSDNDESCANSEVVQEQNSTSKGAVGSCPFIAIKVRLHNVKKNSVTRLTDVPVRKRKHRPRSKGAGGKRSKTRGENKEKEKS